MLFCDDMKPVPPHLKRTFSIRFAAFSAPVIFILCVLLPIAYLMVQSALSEAEERAYERLALEASHIDRHLQEVFSSMQHINAINTEMITSGYLDYRSVEELQRYFLLQVRESDFVSSIYFGNVHGGLANAGRECNGDGYYQISTENFQAGIFEKYLVDANGNSTELLLSESGFDARTRDWYQKALAAEDMAAWSDIYVLFTAQDMALAASYPVYADDGRLLGVAANDLFLGQLSTFLNDTLDDGLGQTLLIDRDGMLIASSEHKVIVFDEDTHTYERFNLESISAPLLNALAAQLVADQIELSELKTAIQITVSDQGERYFVNLKPMPDEQGLDWISVVILPEADFMNDAFAPRRIIIYVFVLLAFLMVGFSLLSIRWLLHPLLLMNENIQKFNKDGLQSLSVGTYFKEINQIGRSFNNLAHRLNHTLTDLYQEIEEHKNSKARLVWSETLYRSVVEDSPGLLCSFLPNGELTFVNKSYAEYFQKAPKDLIGTSFLTFVHKDDREQVMEEISRLNQDNPSNSIVERVFLPNGDLHYQRWVNRVLISENGEIIGYQSFGEDIQREYQIQQTQSALYRISQAANRSVGLNELYRSIHQIIQEIFLTKNLYIALFDDQEELLLPVYYVDEMDPKLPNASKMTGPPAHVLEHKLSLRCTPEEFFALKPEVDFATIPGTPPKIWLGVPLMLDGKALGILAVQDYESEDAFGVYEQEFLEMIAPSIAATIARKKAEENVHNYAQTNALLFKAAQSISETLDLDTLYQTLYRIIAEVIACDFFMVSNYNPEEGQIICAYLVEDGHQQDISLFPPLPLNPTGEDTQSKVILSKEPILLSDHLKNVKTSQTSYYIDANGKLHDPKEKKTDENITRSAIIIPLLFDANVTGVIQVMSYRAVAYTEDDLHIVEALSSQIAVASNNARLYLQAQKEIHLRSEAEAELQGLNAQLEERVKERTIELHERISAVERLNTGMANIMQDLNIANRLAEKNAQELRLANEELETFSFSVSHDLRAPLRHVESFAKLLYQALDDRLTDAEKRYFTNIFTAAEKMRNLISDLLTLSRTSTLDFHLKPVNFNKMIKSVRAELFDTIEGRNIEWRLASLPSAQADPGLIEIVWTNLIANAVKYTRLCETAIIEIGTLPPEEANMDESQQIFFVRDNGVGFDEAYRDKLFGVFQRLHQSDEFEGNGIGLATVNRIIARHGGKVWAESVLDNGATFYFSLPKQIKPKRNSF